MTNENSLLGYITLNDLFWQKRTPNFLKMPENLLYNNLYILYFCTQAYICELYITTSARDYHDCLYHRLAYFRLWAD